MEEGEKLDTGFRSESNLYPEISFLILSHSQIFVLVPPHRQTVTALPAKIFPSHFLSPLRVASPLTLGPFLSEVKLASPASAVN